MQAVKEVQTNLKAEDIYNEDQLELEQKKLDALKVIAKYIGGMQYLSHKKSKEKLRYFLHNNLDYEKTSEQFNTSRNSIEVSISNIGNKIESLIGSNTIDMIMEGKTEEALTQFDIGTGKVKPGEWFIEGFQALLPKPKKELSFSLADCVKEMDLLLMFTSHNIGRVVNKQNQERLAHLLYLIGSTDSKVEAEREILHCLLKAEFSERDGEYISRKEQISQALQVWQRQNIFYSEE
jgi:hypothetical protein